jgi:hypothetical protein
MPTKLNNAITVATVAAICMMAGIARGDEGTDDHCCVDAARDLHAQSTSSD